MYDVGEKHVKERSEHYRNASKVAWKNEMAPISSDVLNVLVLEHVGFHVCDKKVVHKINLGGKICAHNVSCEIVGKNINFLASYAPVVRVLLSIHAFHIAKRCLHERSKC